MAKTTSKGQNVSTLLIATLQLSIPSNKSSSGGESLDVRHKNDVDSGEPKCQITLRNSAVLSPWIAKEGKPDGAQHGKHIRRRVEDLDNTRPALR